MPDIFLVSFFTILEAVILNFTTPSLTIPEASKATSKCISLELVIEILFCFNSVSA